VDPSSPPSTEATVDLSLRSDQLASAGVRGLTIAWVDNNGITRSRTVPISRLTEVALTGVGITTLFAVFDSHDAITFEHVGLSSASGDVRLLPVVPRIIRLAGQPAFAWAPGRQRTTNDEPWPYDQRAVLETQVRRAASVGLSFRFGYELEFFVGRDTDAVEPAHRGPAYSAQALLEIDEFAATLLADLEANGLPVGQLHAEYGLAQVEVSLAATDPLSAADGQVLARQTIHAAARRHGLRVSFAPLINADGVGNGCHIHSSVWRGEQNLLEGGRDGLLDGPGASYVAGLLRDLPAIVGLTAPSVPSLTRLRPGYFASAYAFWGVENREAALRYVPSSTLLGAGSANVELKPSDASGNPYLALAMLIAAGLAGIDERLPLPEPIAEDPGGWSQTERERAGVIRLPETPAQQQQALAGNPRVREALGEPLLGAFVAVRRADAAWAQDRSPDEVVAAHLWRY
jgi:glutamine synthetase